MKEEYEFLNCPYWRYFNDDPLMHIIINEQFENIRKAFFSLAPDVKNILDFYIIKENDFNGLDIDRYLNMLAEKYFYYYEKRSINNEE